MNENNRYLCFNLGTEEFAIHLLSVREVLGMPEITPIPQAPSYFMGIMNLRGQVISVMDLRNKLGIKPQASEETAVIILDLGKNSLGVVVDKVCSVQDLSPEDTAEKPDLDSSKAANSITGVFKRDNRLILILDIAKALSLEDKNTVAKGTAKAA